ncbi:hypothetical protein [Pseudoalteromonas luteoviolacea]|uniref:hypothetical protein n=1 Tax=Pseudoalteromonas luteoviolacea TaxID=43657 RepID=UPI0009BC9BDA|nr:hypothetical protein [Pseudoalteromonas luteoviolacea]TQF72970.1 hypothetical protein FLM44_18885 [Pseudoalteromonas luteoviolacea]
MFTQLIYRLGSNPKRSLKFFFTGIGIFVCAMGLFALGQYHDPVWQKVGLAVLFPALGIAGYGYVGIFANRFSQVISARLAARRAFDSDKSK